MRRCPIRVFPVFVFALAACDGGSAPSASSPSEARAGAPARGASTAAQRPPGPAPVPSDFHLATRIRLRLMADDLVDERALRLRVNGAVVTLEGEVERGEQSVRAEAIAEATYGVASVRNRLEGPEPTAAERRRGARVTDAVLALEPGFAEALTNYATGEPIAPYFVARSPHDVAPPGALVAQAIRAPELAVEPVLTAVSDPVGSETPAASEGPRRHTVAPGETLWSIARDYLGDGNRWQELFEHNRRVIGDDPNGIRAGMVLRLPQ